MQKKRTLHGLFNEGLKGHADAEVQGITVFMPIIVGAGIDREVKPCRPHRQQVLQTAADAGPHIAEILVKGGSGQGCTIGGERRRAVGQQPVRRDIAEVDKEAAGKISEKLLSQLNGDDIVSGAPDGVAALVKRAQSRFLETANRILAAIKKPLVQGNADLAAQRQNKTGGIAQAKNHLAAAADKNIAPRRSIGKN